jgi:hypothetical protein
VKISIGFAIAVFISASSMTVMTVSQVPPSQKVAFFGRFSNMKFTQEHQYGSEVALWKTGNVLIGHFLHSEGLAGDTPTGLIENVNYDPKSGAIGFQAKLSMGDHFCNEHKGVPSRDIFLFKGILNGKIMSGVIKQLDALHDNELVRTEKVQLKNTGIDGAFDPEPSTYAEWEKESRQILEFRGPKW